MSDDDSEDEWLVERIGPGSPAESPRREIIARCRRRAAAVRTKAESITDPMVRAQLLDIARQYEVLATSIGWLPAPRVE